MQDIYIDDIGSGFPLVLVHGYNHLTWSDTGSTLKPITFTFLFSNSGFILANAPSSVVQTGVKSFGCENKTPQLSPTLS